MNAPVIHTEDARAIAEELATDPITTLRLSSIAPSHPVLDFEPIIENQWMGFSRPFFEPDANDENQRRFIGLLNATEKGLVGELAESCGKACLSNGDTNRPRDLLVAIECIRFLRSRLFYFPRGFPEESATATSDPPQEAIGSGDESAASLPDSPEESPSTVPPSATSKSESNAH